MKKTIAITAFMLFALIGLSQTYSTIDGIYTKTGSTRNGLVYYPGNVNNPGINSVSAANCLDVVDGADSSNSSLTVYASVNLKAGQTVGYTAKTASYTVTTSDYVVSDTLTGATYLLPTATGKTGKVYMFKNLSAGTQTVNTTSSQKIDGASSKDITTKKAVIVLCTGTGWIILSYN